VGFIAHDAAGYGRHDHAERSAEIQRPQPTPDEVKAALLSFTSYFEPSASTKLSGPSRTVQEA
jgi:hypothetical protein